MNDSRTLMVPDGLAGLRADAGLSRLTGLSRTQLAEMISAGLVTMDGKTVAKSTHLIPGALMELTFPQEEQPDVSEPQPVENMPIIYDDDDIVVVSKPVGVAAHTSPGWTGPTVVEGLMAAGYRISTSGAAERQGIVQRLDVGTSGLMVLGKSEQGYNVLKNAFRRRAVSKTYWAVVQGLPDPLEGTVDAPIGRHPKGDGRMAVMQGGKPSITHYELMEAFAGATLLRVHLETGRTHQIRVHMQALRHPCVGDSQYGGDPTLAKRLGLTRQWLHAKELGFDHPVTGAPMHFVDELPEDLSTALEILRTPSA